MNYVAYMTEAGLYIPTSLAGLGLGIASNVAVYSAIVGTILVATVCLWKSLDKVTEK